MEFLKKIVRIITESLKDGSTEMELKLKKLTGKIIESNQLISILDSVIPCFSD